MIPCLHRALAGILIFAAFLSPNPLVAASEADGNSLAKTLARKLFRFTAEYSSSLPRDGRISLATHLPGLFGFRFVCLFRPEGAQPYAVLPGDILDSETGGNLVCPDQIEIGLGPKSRVRVSQLADQKIFHLDAGSVRLEFGKTEFAFGMNDLSLWVSGTGVLQLLTVKPESDAYLFLADSGDMVLEVKGGAMAGRTFFASTLGRMELREPGRADVYQVLSGDAFRYADRGVERILQPNLKGLLGGGFQPSTSLWFSGEKIQWVTVGLKPNMKTECRLMMQPELNQPATMLQKFSPETNQFQLALPAKPASKQIYFTICDDEKDSRVSSPLQVP